MRFGELVHMGRYGWCRVGPTWAPASASILRATPTPPVVHFLSNQHRCVTTK